MEKRNEKTNDASPMPDNNKATLSVQFLFIFFLLRFENFPKYFLVQKFSVKLKNKNCAIR